jgi:hypothetical protein
MESLRVYSVRLPATILASAASQPNKLKTSWQRKGKHLRVSGLLSDWLAATPRCSQEGLMLYKGLLAIVALSALSLAVELARSQSDHHVSSVTAYSYMSKADFGFDRVFAIFDTPFDKRSLGSVNTKREMLRREGMARANSATPGERFVLLKARMVNSHVALSMYGVDETLYNGDLGAPITLTFVLSDQKTPMTNSEIDELKQASPLSGKLATVAPAFKPPLSSPTALASFYNQ